MKKLIKILSVFLAVIMAFASTSVAFASTKFYSKYDKKTYTHNTKFDTFNKVVGIDVSEHNKTVDFNKVKADGIDFVYVRVGYTGYTRKNYRLIMTLIIRKILPMHLPQACRSAFIGIRRR